MLFLDYQLYACFATAGGGCHTRIRMVFPVAGRTVQVCVISLALYIG
jgi:hypothetical protein